VAFVPLHGVHTIYATIGDLFAWLCLLGLVALIGLAIVQSRKLRSVIAAVPLPEPLPLSLSAPLHNQEVNRDSVAAPLPESPPAS
jgi:hypothetical protein